MEYRDKTSGLNELEWNALKLICNKNVQQLHFSLSPEFSPQDVCGL